MFNFRRGKINIMDTCRFYTAGAGTAPNRCRICFKFVPSPDADITRIDINNTQSGSLYRFKP
jgi:hypothetical protein